MYFVKYGSNYLHDPRTANYTLLDLSLDCEENSSGFCDFTIYPTHPLYNKLEERDADNPIEVYDDDSLLFAGFIYELGKEFYLDGHVKCKGELGYLSDSIVRPYSTVTRGYGNTAPNNVDGYFEWLIKQHNSQVKSNRSFQIGTVKGSSLDPNNYIFRESNKYPNTFNEIKEKLLDSLGGYLNVRHVDGLRYIDYLAEWTDTNSQILDFGINLTDYTQTDNSEEIATFVVPLGARLSETLYSYDDGYFATSDTTMNAAKDYYTLPFTKSDKIAVFESGITYFEQYTVTFETTDTSPVKGIVYYTKETQEDGSETYTRQDISKFKSGVTYYEQEEYYVATGDTTPSDEKDYYTIGNSYSKVTNLGRFLRYTQYYEYDENQDESNLSLTISGLEDGAHYESGYIKSGDMIYNETAVAKYGWIGITYEDTDITDKENLAKKGVVALKEYVAPKRTIEIKAVDMHLINPDIRSIRVGEYVRVRSRPHNFDSYMLCTRISLDLNNPENSEYTLGTTYDTLTGQQNKRISALNASINKQYEAAAAISEEAKKTAKDASQQINSVLETADRANDNAILAKEAASEAVLSIKEEYATSSTPTDIPEKDTWSGVTPDYSEGVYVWHRITTTYGDGSVVVGEPALLTGNSGQNGEDAITMSITASNGSVFKKQTESTILTAHVYKAGVEQEITDDGVCGSFGTVKWYKAGVTEAVATAKALTVSAAKVINTVTYTCQLEG